MALPMPALFIASIPMSLWRKIVNIVKIILCESIDFWEKDNLDSTIHQTYVSSKAQDFMGSTPSLSQAVKKASGFGLLLL